jgi:hypothetical protein
MESIPIADTLDGDTLAIHLANPGRIVILPRNLERAYARDDGLLEAIEWLCSGRVLRSFGPTRYFEPFGASAGGLAEEGASQVTPTVSATAERTAPPRALVAMSAREHLQAYFRELRDIEEWVVQVTGGPKAYTAGLPPDDVEAAADEGMSRMQAVHERYCTPRLAAALSGSMGISWPPPHDASQFRIRDEAMTRNGWAIFRVAEGVQPGTSAMLVEYRLSPDGDGWWIASTRQLDLEEEPDAARGSCLSRLLRRSD